jgi:hypothetical protein
MRLKSVIAVAAAAAVVGLAAHEPANATDLVHRVHTTADPYAYRSEHRGYYPYYNSGYWVPAQQMRHRYRRHYALPKYYQAWGYPKVGYYHREWHYRHHGRHYPWHW